MSNQIIILHVSNKSPSGVAWKGSYMNIYVGNLSFNTTVEDLKTMFADFGEVAEAKIIMNRHTRQSKGFGFIDMPSNSEADQAIKALNGKPVDGRLIKVNPADPGGKRRKRKRASGRRRW